jgi:hypothetical protein
MRRWGNLLMKKNGDHTLEVPKFEGNVENTQSVAITADGDIVVMSPTTSMSRTDALVKAAWIVAIADRSENFAEFRGILKAVLET